MTKDKKQAEGVDLSAMDLEAAASAGADCHILHPTTGVELGITIRVLGVDSPEYRQVRRKMVDELVKKGKGKPVPEEEREERLAEAMASVTVGWSGVVWEGEALSCTRENAAMLYKKRGWVLEQLEQFSTDRANFFRD